MWFGICVVVYSKRTNGLCCVEAHIADDRKAVQQADRVGLPLKTLDGCAAGRTQLLSAEFIAEALTISDLFELNEVASVELLLAGDLHHELGTLTDDVLYDLLPVRSTDTPGRAVAPNRVTSLQRC